MTMLGWQICRPHEVESSGKACLDKAGRWNSGGSRIVYLSEHPALAVLEARVHLDMEHHEMEHDHLLLRVALPAHSIEELEEMPADPAAFGDAWLRDGRSAVLRVPSIVVQEGRNLLLNPDHPEGRAARVVQATPFRFDPRLWRDGAPRNSGGP
ncbi:RES family NAD+ phosphorylase [Falsiroseomonas sp. CW058]|uniref:RES family NAD+ phosphorylase n=1 Tax=Falsiroseomonas sp. CW058 TaxID=3388664 RepID=UPI003D318475